MFSTLNLAALLCHDLLPVLPGLVLSRIPRLSRAASKRSSGKCLAWAAEAPVSGRISSKLSPGAPWSPPGAPSPPPQAAACLSGAAEPGRIHSAHKRCCEPARPEPHGEPSRQALPARHKEVGSDGGMQILPGVCVAWDPRRLLVRFTHFKTNNLLDWSVSFLSFFPFWFFFFFAPKQITGLTQDARYFTL